MRPRRRRARRSHATPRSRCRAAPKPLSPARDRSSPPAACATRSCCSTRFARPTRRSPMRIACAPTSRDPPAPPSRTLPLCGGNDRGPPTTNRPPPPPPLAVRRATPEVPRVRGESRGHSLELDLDLPPPASPSAGDAIRRAHAADWPATIAARDAAAAAPLGARFIAMVVDVVLLAAVDAVVVYFTVQVCGITLWEIVVLPEGPL